MSFGSRRNRRTGRVDVDVIRYHQGGWVSGTVTVDGETHEVGSDEWFGFRDHSWGVRQSVGAPLDRPDPDPAGRPASKGIMKWTPSFFRRPDGDYYETAIFVTGAAWNYTSAYVNEADGSQARVRTVEPRMTYDPHTRFVRGGELLLAMDSGEERVIEVEALGESGFFLRTAGYGDGPARSTARGAASSTSTASTSPTAGTTSTCRCSDSSATLRFGSAKVTPSATGSWRAS